MNPAKRVRTQSSRAARPASIRTGFFATLANLLRGPGSGAPAIGALRRLTLIAALASFACLLAAGPAAAAETSPWWHLTSNSHPTVLAPEAKGEVVALATNLGDADTNGSAVAIEDKLPSGLKVLSVKAIAGAVGLEPGPVACTKTLTAVKCSFEAELPPYDQIEVRIKVEAEAGVEALGTSEITVSGGGAPSARLLHPLALGEEPPFGVESYELTPEEHGGAPATQAGSHPYQLTTTITLNQNGQSQPTALAKDLDFHWPAGLLGNPSPIPQCTLGQFLTTITESSEGVNACPPSTAVGAAVVTVNEPGGLFGEGAFPITVPLFNLEPAFGEPARFGFYVSVGAVPVIIDPALRSGNGEDYGIDVTTTNVSQTVAFLSSQVTVWGVPGDPRHDSARGWSCLAEARNRADHRPCNPTEAAHPPAFVTLPTSCSGSPLLTSVDAKSWANPLAPPPPFFAGPAMPTVDGCNQLPFAPQIHSEPTSSAATSPTGLNFDLNFKDEGLISGEGLAQSQMKRAVVTLPVGFTTNPSVAEGLKACSLHEYEATTVALGSGCTEESKVGDVEIESPLVAGKKVPGSLFVAKQGENPNHNLLSLYLVARSPELGVLVKQVLKVTPNTTTGQLTTEVDNAPQLPFSHFHLAFRQGQRSPLITPPACGTYTVEADLYPYSEPSAPNHQTSSFQITQGPEGLPCPSGGVPPFHPGLEAGTTNNAAGTYSPFVTHITRKDSEQEITRFSIKLPPGVIGKLAGVSECSDAGVAAAKALEKEGGGTIEESSPSCPKNSEIGHSLVGSGVGNVLAYAPGKLYLAGPYHGSPISIVSITAAKVGPFDLGTVVVRFALDIDHETAEVSVDGANSDPIPHIVDGIPVHLRDIRAYVDRPNFTLNPTSCAKKSTASTILGSGLNFVSPLDDNPVTVSSPFQAADCASLGFKPSLALSLSGGKTHRGGLPAFKAVLTYPKKGAYSNIARAQVTLPPSEILEQGHLEKVCPKSIFITGSTPGENCPKNSIYGTARAFTPLLDEPLEGPVFLRTGYGTVLPELTATLNNKQIHIVLAGKIDSVQKKGTEISRIRNTFELVPDAPVSKFVLEMKGGDKGLLVNKTNICQGTHKAIAAFTAQNGKLQEFEPVLKAAACGKKSKKPRHG